MNSNVINVKQNRPEFDCIRIAAAILVVTLHVTAQLETAPLASDCLVRFNQILNAVCFVAVPLFVMLSGALLLDEQRSRESLTDFYKKRFWHLCLPVTAWSAIYLIINFVQNDLNMKNILFMVLRGKPFYHLWYLYMLIGLYLLTPAFRRLFWQCGFKEKVWWTALVLFMVWANEAGDFFLGVEQNESRRLFFNLCIPFIGLFLSGNILAELAQRRNHVTAVALLGIGALAAMGYSCGKPWSPLLISYSSMINNIAAMCCFYCLMCKCNHAGWSRLPALGRSTLGVYLVHPLLLLALFPVIRSSAAIGWETYIVWAAAMVAASFLISLIGRNVYGLRKIF